MSLFVSKRKVLLFLEKDTISNLKNDRTVVGEFTILRHPALCYGEMSPGQFKEIVDLYTELTGVSISGKYLVEYLTNSWEDGHNLAMGKIKTLDMSYVCAIYRVEPDSTLHKVYYYARYTSVFKQDFDFGDDIVKLDNLPILRKFDLEDAEVWEGYIQTRNAYVKSILRDLNNLECYSKVVCSLPIKELSLEDLQATVKAIIYSLSKE